MRLKNYLILAVFPLFIGTAATAQSNNPSTSIYTYEIQLSNSENMDYRLEQHAFLVETLEANKESSHFDKSRGVYIIKTTKNIGIAQLKNTIEEKGIRVIGDIARTEDTSTTNTH